MSRKGWLIGGAVVVVIAVVVALIVVSVSGGDSSSSEASTSEIKGGATVAALVKGLPQAEFAIGKPSAPVTVREFVDPQCPVCKAASEKTLPAVIKGPVKDGTARLIIEPLTFIGSDSSSAALAIAAAAQQDRGFAYTEILYANQGQENSGWATEEVLTGIARATPGLDVAAWTTAKGGEAAANAVFAASDRGQGAGVSATPTFVIKGPGGSKVLTGAVDSAEVISAIEAVS